MRKNELHSFVQKLQQIVEQTNSPVSRSIVLILIDNLPMLNLAFGHIKAHQILLGLQAEIAQSFGKAISIYQIESDQIAIIYNEADAAKLIEAEITIKKIVRNFGAKYAMKIHIAATIGYKPLEYDKPAEQHLSELYHSLYFNNSNWLLQDSQEKKLDTESSQQEMVMANEISLALSGDKLRLAYQPIISAETGKIAHYEGLLRLINDDGQLQSAGIFIPIAERMGFIDAIDHRTLELTIAKLKAHQDITLAVNISHLTIGNREWLKTFFRDVSSDIAQRLIIEITETAANQSLKDTAYFIATMQEAGCQVALDDFGSGHTSYRQVRSLSIDMIKIDGSLITDIETNKQNQILVSALVEYFKEYGLKIVAEHVDNGAAAKMLIDYGIDYLQGHYFGKPSDII